MSREIGDGRRIPLHLKQHHGYPSSNQPTIHDLSAANSREPEANRHGNPDTVRLNKTDPQDDDKSPSSDPNDQNSPCSICHDLKFPYSEQKSLPQSGFHYYKTADRGWAALSDIKKSMLKGCPTCSLLYRGISVFNDSMNAHGEQSYVLSNMDKVEFDCGRRRNLLVQVFSSRKRLEYSLEISSVGEYPMLLGDSSTPDIPQTLDVDYTTGIIQNWVAKCESSHELCNAATDPDLPTRVLDLGTSANGQDFKLLVTNGLSGRYIALSYCWGNAEALIITTTATLPDRESGISFTAIPKTFQDAIQLTRALGIRYLWIDALCILQDDKDDWGREAAKMSEVYSNSYLTLAASSGSTPEHGLFSDRWTRCSYIPGFISYSTAPRHQRLSVKSIPIPGNDDQLYVRPRIHLAHDRFGQFDNAEKHREDAPLLTRAWAYQERLLSIRTIHFHAEEIVWECRSGIDCECGDISQSGKGWLKQSLAFLSSKDAVRHDLGHVWLDLVSEYSRLHLTKESDRLPALSGLAKSLGDKALGSYLCGIWRQDFVRGLLFERVNAMQMIGPIDAMISSQPSWSWASIPKDADSAISYDSVLMNGFKQSPDFQIIKVDCDITGPNPYSWVAASELQIQATVQEVSFDSLHARQTSFEFSNDRRIGLKSREMVFCALVGSNVPKGEKSDTNYALVLRRMPGTGAYSRVGILKVAAGKFFTSSTQQLLDVT